MANHVILPAAQAEYTAAIDWYAEQSATAANRFVAEVEAAIDAICVHPESFPHWDDEYRYYLLKKFPYFVAYRLTSEAIVIVAIRHSSRDQDAWK